MAEECKTEIKDIGLRGVVIASSKISDVRGAEGKLIYRDYTIQSLAEKVTFEETAYLLLFEKLPAESELADFTARIRKEYEVPEAVFDALRTIPPEALPMDVLQAGISLLAAHDPDASDQSLAAHQRISEKLIAKMPALVAGWQRIRNGQPVVKPDPSLGVGANFLYMLSGTKPTEEVAHFMDTALVLHAEHSFNASTFAARAVCSTRAHMYAAIGAAVGSLSGELHGGANTRVMQMLKEIDDPKNVDDYIRGRLEAGDRIMGLGHAVYKTDDPRALILKPMAKKMGEFAGETKWFEMSEMLEVKGKKIFKEKKGIDIFINVDFYSASLYYAMGIPLDLFTPIFAISRITGWSAHVLEERFPAPPVKPMLYRPLAEYNAEYCGGDECEFIPMDER